ncbi:hypothetical protein A2631_00405 [Candidatus Daviesbacteria bacterium RIFCSPHIGHO2_01_FULL_44_29]|uniref:Nudix hydrolase domain-containing protein n=1 Tax=Candidatus Daviesbacteria bacterium RIFCSPHIGHO2_02_FULL_43_12 TaxID=1797776 RepID=A0A1F5KIY4_9BACT|nr:MAG: hypothetical protein A2631_00405 [Candidatus Daviesbacteria bacterium RIFCSPHIGHO2_01_FULL_44_29]OGE40896.1 MAG: hypothetical protein A3D25_03165 [Candidatus Daviesbacteria bacterium RIFCSPHIGHO2_02_FULL_43_12]OGE70048.1 MAG: hypothetical protein A3B55_02515 [Candidatus Daviesbacteria bacterium RIFCSPLOWO2_01_FULL_43_15]
MNKNIFDILAPNQEWLKTIEHYLASYKLLYNLKYIHNREKISPAFFQYCLKGKYFVIVAIYNNKREFFIQRDFLKRGERWELVGGWVERNELPDQALDRIVRRETGSCLVEATPLSLVTNSYFTAEGNQTQHYGLAYMGRVKDDYHNSQNGTFSQIPKQGLNKKDLKILNLSNQLLKDRIIEPPVNELTSQETLGKIYYFHKYLVKPIAYFGSSRILKGILFKTIQDRCTHKGLVLDVACGDDKLLFSIAKIAKLVVANDISRQSMSKLIHRPENNIIFSNRNLLDLVFKNTFDVVICKNVMHHMRSIEEIELLLKTLKQLGKRIIILDIEDPKRSFIASLWNNYYVHILKDQGGLFMSFEQFKDLINLSYSKSTRTLKKIQTIKGPYMLAVIDQY